MEVAELGGLQVTLKVVGSHGACMSRGRRCLNSGVHRICLDARTDCGELRRKSRARKESTVLV